MSEDEDLITREEVMERLLAIPALRRVALTCVLPAVRRNGEWLFRRKDLESWIEQQGTAKPFSES